MPALIENYGLIGDMKSAALVSRDGSIDWLCFPRFDSEACMAALLGRDEHGCWLIQPGAQIRRIDRRYRPGTMILETDFECDGGTVRLIDFMPSSEPAHALVRIVQGLEGSVPMTVSLRARFGYGRYSPWVRRSDDGLRMTAAPDSLLLRSPAPLEADDKNIFGVLNVRRGDQVPFSLYWHEAASSPPREFDPLAALGETEREWKGWAARSKYEGPYKEVVDRSLITLRAMTYAPSGGIVAAPTLGLPEDIGGVRNWDYRYCWIRDATLTLNALMLGGYTAEAQAWRTWLLNAAGGDPDSLQIMYGINGERRLTEFELPWLPGYEESRPVRVGNAASEQFQLDVYGELIHAIYEARVLGVPQAERSAIGPARRFLEVVEKIWQRPDDGIWEVRGGRRHFVHSKLMAWVAADRGVKLIQEFFPLDRDIAPLLPKLIALRSRIHRDITEHGFNPYLNSFTQSYGGQALDAGLLLIPPMGFLPASDPRVQGTIAAIEKDLLEDGFVLRYRPEHAQDGLPGSEGVFLACSFWLVDVYAASGRVSEAVALFERLIALRNDLDLLAEEYDTKRRRLVGNFPQAFSHLALINSAGVLRDAGIAPRPEQKQKRVAAA
jgi:GH15 family glucan-1,4-alpha-glucosidase